MAPYGSQGATPLEMSQPQFAAFLQTQVENWANIVTKNRIDPIT